MPKLYNEENMRAVLGPYRIGTVDDLNEDGLLRICLLYTSPSPRDQRGSRMPSSA